MARPMGMDGEGNDLSKLKRGGAAALAELYECEGYKGRLLRLVAVGLDSRLRARVEPPEVLQEAFVLALKQLPAYLDDPQVAPYVWLRQVVLDVLSLLHRSHLKTAKRDARREVMAPEVSNDVLAAGFVGRLTSPSQALSRAEREERVKTALDRLEEADRVVIALTHYEHLTRLEAAEVLGISVDAAQKRYRRALKRFEAALSAGPGGLEGL